MIVRNVVGDSVSHGSNSGRSPIPVHLRFVRWFCGWEEGEKGERHHRQLEQHLDAITSLEQTRTQRNILYVNLAVIFSIALFFYIYFCISPFSREEIDRMREEALEKVEIKNVHNADVP